MSKNAAVILADGFEPVEAIAPVDVLRRGGIDVKTVSITGAPQAIGAHAVEVTADTMLEETDLLGFDMIIIPGGSGGAAAIAENTQIGEVLRAFAAEGKAIGAICAGPTVLAKLGLLDGHKATCYPGLENTFPVDTYQGNGVFTDGNLVTASGPAYAFEFGLACLALLTDERTAKAISEDLLMH